MGIIFIEGLPCAGKSELIKHLEAEGKSVCHELGRVLISDEFPGNGKTFEEIKKIDQWFIQKEHVRMQNSSKQFFDRSYLTHLCYAYAYSRWISLPSFEPTIRRYQVAIENKGMELPNYVVYIDISSDDSIARQHHKITTGVSKGLPDFWRQDTFLENTRMAYDVLLSSLLHIPVCRVDADWSTYDKVKYLKSWLSSQNMMTDRTLDFDSYIARMRNREIWLK